MSPTYYFDTDTLTLFRYGAVRVVSRVNALPVSEIGTTVISVEVQLTGWYTSIRQAKTTTALERAYAQLTKTVRFFSGIFVQEFPGAAIARYQHLRSLKQNIGPMDLRIAGIVLHFGGTLVSRNLRDFNRVPGLIVEDWA